MTAKKSDGKIMQSILNILLLSVAIFLIAKLVPGIHVKSFTTAILVAIVYSIINFLLGGILRFLSLPAIVLTLGLFLFVVNAFMLWLTAKLLDDFHIDSFLITIIAAVLITLVERVLRAMVT